MILLLSIATLLVAAPIEVAGTLNRLRSLQYTPESYILFNPDWTRLTHAASVCGWIRNTGTSSTYNLIFNYGRYFENGGYWMTIYNSFRHVKSSFKGDKTIWHHVCFTWESVSGTQRFYGNGELLASHDSLTKAPLPTGAQAALGLWTGSGHEEVVGQMAYFNVYAKEMTAAEVAKMAGAGLCSDISKVNDHESSRAIRWEDLVKLERTGVITDEYVSDCLEIVVEELDRVQNATTELLRKTLIENERLRKQSNETRRNSEEKEKLEKKLAVTQSKLEEISICSNRTWHWDIFLSESYLNQTLTSEDAQNLRTGWDEAADKLVGNRITEYLLEISRNYDRDRHWSMLFDEAYFNKVFTQEMADKLKSAWDHISDKLVGVTMTKEVIELLTQVTNQTNCGN